MEAGLELTWEGVLIRWDSNHGITVQDNIDESFALKQCLGFIRAIEDADIVVTRTRINACSWGIGGLRGVSRTCRLAQGVFGTSGRWFRSVKFRLTSAAGHSLGCYRKKQ